MVLRMKISHSLAVFFVDLYMIIFCIVAIGNFFFMVGLMV